MGATPSPDPSATGAAPLWVEFDAEVVTLERGIARAAQVASVVGLLLAAGVGVLVTASMGLALAVLAVASIVWFSIAYALLSRGRALAVVLWANLAVLLFLPCFSLIIMASTQGAAYALGSWVAPLLFAFAIILTMTRLRPVLPLVFGSTSAAAYLAIYFLVLRNAPLVGDLDGALYRPAMQLTRAATLVFFGLLGALATRAIRSMVGRAAKKSREKDLFGKYRVGARIASGGMGSVYEAVYCPEGGFERKVAIKRVHPHLALDPAFVTRFREEAELGARLAHPNIVTVLDFGREGDTYFFAMEFVDGMDLAKVRRRCKKANLVIPSRLVAFIGREIAEGLAFAHEVAQGADGKALRVVHRDLNPANILVSRTGQVKISDFGVATVLGEEAVHATKRLVGKFAYLAPELARGAAFDTRVDIFALGLVLWELLCLKQAYARDSDAATLSAVAHSSVEPPSLLRPDLAGTEWDAFCEKALQPDCEKRFASAREVSAALAEILEREGMPPPGELLEFLRQVEAIPAAEAGSSQSLSAQPTDPLESPTVID